jgi:poly-gamma-glutamate capsule biosynthesis protein CapA/YwtB (metallophosphatase superfamily)
MKHQHSSLVVLLATLVVACFAPFVARAQRQGVEIIPGPGVGWSIAAAGDAIMNRRLMPFDNDTDPRFRDMVRVIKGADAGLLNLEQSLFRHAEFKGWGEVENGGNYEVGPPEVALDLKAMGFTMMNRANNHTTDYGVEGLRVTDKLLDEVGIVHAGTGMNLGQASRPGYLDTAKGRIALVGLATTFTNMSRAGAARNDTPGRPGLNPLRVNRRYEVDALTFQALNAAASRLSDSPRERAEGGPLRLFGATIYRGAETRVVETLNQDDEDRILREIRNATQMADFVIVTSHSHEPGNDSRVPPAWMKEFTHKCIDAGAVAYIIHGPHQLRGVEIYKGRPIFYSLGNFVFHNETIDPMPADYYEGFNLSATALSSDVYDARFRNGTTGFPSAPWWYQSVVAVLSFRGTELTEIKMYPVDLQWKAPRPQRGSPRLAAGQTQKDIIERMTQMSADLGTTLGNDNGILVWRSGSKSSQ